MPPLMSRPVLTLKALTLDHVVKFEKELADAGIDSPAVAPILLPDYSTDEVAARRWPEARTVAEMG